MTENETNQNNDDVCNTNEIICEDSVAVASETKNLMIEGGSSLVMLLCTILLLSFLSILLSTWLAKTITNSPTSFSSIVTRYFGLDRNITEQYLTWWTPKHVDSNKLISNKPIKNQTNITVTSILLEIPYSDYPNFHTIVLPFLLLTSILLAALAYYARIKCTNRDFAWGAVPKIPLTRIDLNVVKQTIDKAQLGIDYTIVQGTKDEPVVFALAETVEPLRKEGDIVDEGTQYESDDVLKVITHTCSAPDLHQYAQIVPSSTPSNEQKHMIELLQREPLPTLSPSKNFLI